MQLVRIIPLSKRAKNRVHEHKTDVFEKLSKAGDIHNKHRILVRCVNPDCHCDQDATGVRWLGWFVVGTEISNDIELVAY